MLRPEPDPVGVNVDPLGEPLGASVFPDGFMVLLEPPVVRPTVEPGGLAMPGPFTDDPVLGATELPAPDVPADVPPALLPLLCASANVLESASAPANAIVMSFMVVSLVVCDQEETRIDDGCSLLT